MSKRIGLVALILLVTGISFASFAGALDKFLAAYSGGNLHALLLTDPVKLIKVIGEEPASYDYYESGAYIFTYTEADESCELRVLAVIWKGGSIKELRVRFTHNISVDDALKVLGYSQEFFSSPSQATVNMRLGAVPYHARQFRAKDAVIERCNSVSFPHDVVFTFLLNHCDDSVYMLIIQYD